MYSDGARFVEIRQNGKFTGFGHVKTDMYLLVSYVLEWNWLYSLTINMINPEFNLDAENANLCRQKRENLGCQCESEPDWKQNMPHARKINFGVNHAGAGRGGIRVCEM
jgi:hypothetical protein